MSTGRTKLGRKQEQAIAALLSEPNHEAAAHKAGIAESTLTRWLTLPEFAAAYRAARQRVLEDAIGELRRGGREAAETLRASLKTDRAGDRIRAADVLLNHLFRAVELGELAERIAALEAVQQEREDDAEQEREDDQP